MMRLSNMVTGLAGDKPARALIQRWEHDEGSLQLWRASSNFVYRFKREGQVHYLRFSFEEDNGLDRILAELDFISYLHKRDYKAAVPVRSSGGRLVECVSAEEGVYYGVVFTEAAGFSIPAEQITIPLMEQWGRSLGSLHALSSTYAPDSAGRRHDWKDVLDEIEIVLRRHPSESAALTELGHLRSWLDSLPVTSDEFGLIHYDFQQDNVFWDGDSDYCNVIDFDDSMYHWYAMDIVTALADLQAGDGWQSDERIRAFLQAYRTVFPLAPILQEQFHKFSRFAGLYEFARTLRSLENSDIDAAPSWYEPLRVKLNRGLERRRLEFIEPW